MADVIFIAITLAFFALCVAYVKGLDRMVRATEDAESSHEEVADDTTAEEVAA
jgi:hypothetical protein